MGGYVKKKKDMVFQSVDSLQQIVNVVNEAAAAVNDSKRTIKESAIPEVLAGALGAGIGGVGSFAALYGLGVVGLSAAGITSVEQIALYDERAKKSSSLSVDERLALQEQILKLEKLIAKTETAAWKEQQPKKQFELYTRLRGYKQELEDLKHGES